MEIQQRRRVAITSSFFPVDESLLPQLNISPAQHEELRRYALQAALDTVRDGPSWGRSNIEKAVSNGWKVLSARPTACFMTKRQTKKKKRKGSKRATQTLQSEQQLEEDDKRSAPPTPRVTIPGVTSLGSFHGSDFVRGQMNFQPFAPVPLEAASGQHFMAHAVLPNSLEDVMNTLYCEHTREMRALKRKVYGEAALDCCVLQTLEGATLEDPFWYIGLKWLALRSPMQALMASREFVYLEHLGTHVDPETGRRMLYRVTQSVHIRGYGGQDSYFGLTRGHIEAAFVYWMDDENEVRNPLLHVCAKGRIHMKGNMPDSVMYRYLKSFWRSERSLFPANRSSGSSIGITLAGTEDSVEQPNKSAKKKKKKKRSRRRKVPSGPPLEMSHEWVADELRPRCSVCNKKFRLVRRFKHHCRACGEVICRDCTFHHRVNVRATQSFRGLRGTVAASVDVVSDAKHITDELPPTKFDETMTCSFDNQVEEEEKNGGGEFDASQSLVNARKAVNGPMETAVLGGDSIVCVVMAKVCLRCLQSVPLVNRSKSKSTQRRRHSEMALNGDVPAIEGDEYGLVDDYPLRPQTWTPDNREVEELDGLDEPDQTGEPDLPMLVLDDDDAESVDGLAEMKRRPGSYAFDMRPGSSMFVRPGSYAQEWNGQEDGGLDSNANHERVMILSPHALSTSSSVTSTQMKEFMEKDESSYDSSGRSERFPSHHSIEIPSDVEDDIQFYPTQTNCIPDEESKLPADGSQGRMSSYTAGFDPNSLFELKDEEHELAASAAAATATVSATEKVLRRMRDLQDEALYQNRQVPSPSSSTTSLYSDNEDECSEIDEPMQDLRQALAQVESSLADQARILFTLEQERKKEAAAEAASPKA
ncbi:1-phosphatidylinositol 3-phosphate 5-kinase fab1 [Phytophthora citrophthora]|uniref:1-phosphatidylinositol 3-phosphate 5-kinase fab1 n=1 Tax=Phytophthora citrophthora TaxID=4793 RepID=A0AAD9G3G8_9STRA|nr:1-phosphatidylinositol 3-phosphate 5-kinase fab1 [Phytophthora citrophthora]